MGSDKFCRVVKFTESEDALVCCNNGHFILYKELSTLWIFRITYFGTGGDSKRASSGQIVYGEWSRKMKGRDNNFVQNIWSRKRRVELLELWKYYSLTGHYHIVTLGPTGCMTNREGPRSGSGSSIWEFHLQPYVLLTLYVMAWLPPGGNLANQSCS